MPGKKAFKVVIVGAGITGLALANMLEALGIDFVVLEGYKEIAPFIGASIVVQGTLARLLDQLGCWEDVLKTWNRPTEIMSMSGPVGTPWLAHIGNMEHIERRCVISPSCGTPSVLHHGKLLDGDTDW